MYYDESMMGDIEQQYITLQFWLQSFLYKHENTDVLTKQEKEQLKQLAEENKHFTRAIYRTIQHELECGFIDDLIKTMEDSLDHAIEEAENKEQAERSEAFFGSMIKLLQSVHPVYSQQMDENG